MATDGIVYHCVRIARTDNLAAILVTSKSRGGTAVVLHRDDEDWALAGTLPLTTRGRESIPGWFLRGRPSSVLILRQLAGWGTGTVLEVERWYLICPRLELVLEYPVRAYVVGWGLRFDRHIEAEHLSLPDLLEHGAYVEIAVRVKYQPAEDDKGHRADAEIKVARTIRLGWNAAKRRFVPRPDSELSAEDAMELYGDNDASFVARNLARLLAIGKEGRPDVVSWISDLAERSHPDDSDALRKVVGGGTG